jgi:YHS domain-containing protein
VIRHPVLVVAACLAASTVAVPALAAQDPVYTGFFSSVAVSGYDPVAYFTQGRPVPGRKSFAASHKGAEYRFASAAHRDAFKADPDR